MSSEPLRIAHYTITAKLGEGGMGAVYRATDTKLNRDVAVKTLPDSFAGDPDRLARFTREAQVLASLNHPNIAQIYGVEERALVMELVEGEHPRGPMALDAALPVIHQLIDALEYAHEKGIVHRDLKPANIKVTPEGRVKVLDFGLAKAMSGQQAASGNPQNSPTLTMGATTAGAIIGTAGYMAPEQARGHDADKRVDIWAFGAVVYELVTGEQLFAGATVSDSLAAVLTRDPDLQRVPAELRKLVRLCLVRDVKLRLRDIGDARIAIADGVAGPAPAAPAASSRLPWIAAAALAVLSVALAALWLRRPVEVARAVQFTLLPPDQSSFYDPLPAVSPDGRQIVFGAGQLSSADRRLFVRDLESTAPRPLAGTDKASYPFWSPDSRFIGFFANGKLKKIAASGGPALTLADAPSAGGGTWGAGDVIVFNAGTINAGIGGPLVRVAASGGTPEPVTGLDTARDESNHRWPSFLPDGRHFLFLAICRDREKTAVWVGDLQSKERRMVLNASSNAVYDPRGFLLFMRDRTLLAQPFHHERLETSGDAFPVAEKVDYAVRTWLGSFSISQTGVLTWLSGGARGLTQLTWLDRAGKPLGTVGKPGTMQTPVISPDGSRVAVARMDEQTGFYNIWLHDLAHDTSSRFTFNDEMYPSWSPDGSRLVYAAERSGQVGLYMKPVNGSGQEELLFQSSMAAGTSWSRDGKSVLFTRVSEKTAGDLWVLPNPLDPANRKPWAFLETAANERYGSELSPDGKYLAYASNESGIFQVYVQSFPNKEAKFQISTNGGSQPVWSRDGKELFFNSPRDLKFMAADVKTSPRFEHGVPRRLFDLWTQGVGSFGVSPDGKRFLAPVPEHDSNNATLTVVLNWHAGVKQ